MARKMEVLIVDIETAPVKANLWRPDMGYVPHQMMEDDIFMLSWAARWRGQKKIHSDIVDPDEAVARQDLRIVKSLADIIREAEAVIAHNAKKFDLPKINGRLAVQRVEPLEPFRTVDTLQLSRKSFGFSYNHLDYLAQIFLDEHKIRTDFELWRMCIQGHKPSLDKMLRYNQKDVKLLEEVFDAMLPYLRGVPRLAVAEKDMEWACPNCASGDVIKRGFHDTNASRFQTWECKSCGSYSRERKGTIEPRLALVSLPGSWN